MGSCNESDGISDSAIVKAASKAVGFLPVKLRFIGCIQNDGIKISSSAVEETHKSCVIIAMFTYHCFSVLYRIVAVPTESVFGLDESYTTVSVSCV